MPSFYSPIDLNGLELRNAITQNLASAPAAPTKGRRYFNSAINVEMVWNGTAWRPLDAAALTDGSIKIASLEVDPRARSTHTGTQAASTISDLAATVQAYRLNQFAAPTANVSCGSKEITDLLDPTTAQSAATRNYVDAAVQNMAAGIDSKASVRTVSTTNITLSGTPTIDGVALVAGNRHLAAGQTTASQNGVYVVAAGAWTRALDADQSSEITPGAFWFVEEGTVNGKTQWRVNNTGAITLGTTAISIVQWGAASAYTASTGLTLVGNDFRVNPKANGGIVADATGVSLDATVAVRRYAATVTHDGATTAFTITHNLGTTDVQVVVRDSAGAEIIVDNQATGTNTVVLTWGVAQPNATTFRAIVQG